MTLHWQVLNRAQVQASCRQHCSKSAITGSQVQWGGRLHLAVLTQHIMLT